MSAYLDTEQKPENDDNLNHKKICMQNNELEISADLKSKAVFSDLTESGERYFLKNEIDEVELTQKSVSELSLDPTEHIEDSSSIKTITHKDNHETSPFKQVVRGFVLNKLSKKVGSSTLLSGLSEKLVKKLAEGKELSDLVYVNKNEPNISISGLKESCELHDSLSCELKSVVANDLTDVANVEEATECFEELKYSLTDSGIESKKSVHKIVTSISVPSSPARFNKTSPPSVSGSLSNIEQYSELQPVVIADSHEILKESTNSMQSTSGFKIEAESLCAMEQSNNIESCSSSDVEYPLNVYAVNEEEKIPVSHKIADFFSSLQSVFRSLPLSHLFLLASVIIHNSPFVCSYLALIFDALIIAYICYGYIYIILHKPYLDAFQHISTPHPQLESATIHVDKEVKEVKGHVKLLKGNYDPDEIPQNYITDLVAICIEKCCLKVSQPQKYSSKRESEREEEVFSSYDLCGAKFLIVPKGLSKKSIWKKKYPICIILPLTSKKSSSVSDNSEDLDKTCTDYFSFVPYEDGLFESTKQKAMYFFALTDREKESWFWALHNSLAECDKNSCMQIFSQCDASPKHDLSTISYSSLLEMNSDENLPEDSFEIYSEVKLSSKTKSVLNFDVYMTTLFENYKKKINTAGHSGSFEEHVLDSKQDMHKTYSFLSDNIKIPDHSSVDWLNVALGRFFYDFLTQKYWSDDIKARIQKKLDKIEMPTFVESLQVSDVFLGTSLPQIHTVSNLVRDSFGMWIDFDFNYDGNFQMTLKTRLKMTRGKHLENTGITDPSAVKQNGDSIDSSDEDESEAKSHSVNRNKLFNKIEKWISYRHFQTVAQSKFVKRYVGDISNMPLTLTVEVNALHGILTVNIPPVPSDRVWYGFRKDPVLSLTAYPKVGTREINLSAVVQMIERKLIQEFKKALVMPNMDDLIIPIMYTPVYDH